VRWSGRHSRGPRDTATARRGRWAMAWRMGPTSTPDAGESRDDCWSTSPLAAYTAGGIVTVRCDVETLGHD
jgi:hypothetical protein